MTDTTNTSHCRPVLWATHFDIDDMDLMTDADKAGRKLGSDSFAFALYDQSALDAAVAAERARWESAIGAVMPADFKQWRDSPSERPETAAWCITNAKEQADQAWAMLAEGATIELADERERCASLCDGVADVCADTSTGSRKAASHDGSELSDGLGPLPEYAHEFRPRWPGDDGGFSSAQMRAYASREVAAERERCAQIVERVQGWEGVRDVAARIRA